MVIILSGASAVRKHYIACSIANSYDNTVPVNLEGLTFKLHLNPIEVYKGGELVYQPATDVDGGVATLINGEGEWDTESGEALLASAKEAYVPGGVKTHINDEYFDSIFEDTQAGPATEDENLSGAWTNMMAEFNPEVVNVCTGIFSPFYINKLKAEYAGEVRVYNITRNPSVAYLFDDTYIGDLTDGVADSELEISIGVPHMGGLLLTSVINNCLLTHVEGVTTIKFEDIISSGSITIDGNDITVGEFENYNGIITEYEHANISSLVGDEKAIDVSQFNAAFQNLASAHPNLPNDVFAELNYEPIDYSTATGSPS